MKKLITLSVILGSMQILVNAQVIHVPADQPTIQAGIDVATDGDTVLVTDSTYYENINFKGKAITVASQFILDGDTSHISKTIIDGSQYTNADTASTVIMVSGEDTTSVLMGFTIQGGRGTNCVPRQDDITRKGGGGIYMFKSGGLIYRNIIKNNHLEDPDIRAFFGGGFCVWLELNHTAIIRDNWIHHNTITANIRAANGGGVSLKGGRVICEGNVISDNGLLAPGWTSGGGIFWEVSGKEETIEEGIIRNNMITNNTIYCDESTGGGGGYYQGKGTNGKYMEVYNNVFSNNITNSCGGAILAYNTVGAIFNNTIADNLQDENYHSVELFPEEGGLVLFNNIIYSSEDISYPDIGFYGDNTTYIYHNLLNKPLNTGGSVVAEGNIYPEPGFKPGSFELAQNSPAVGRGIDSLFILDTYYLAPGTDLNGNPRPNPIDGRVDIGAIESPYERYVGVGIEQRNAENLKIYPNPANTLLTIETGISDHFDIDITSLNGQLVFSKEMEGTTHQLDLSSFQKGVYFITIRSKDLVTTRKVIKL